MKRAVPENHGRESTAQSAHDAAPLHPAQTALALAHVPRLWALGTAPGAYRIIVGMYAYPSFERLAIDGGEETEYVLREVEIVK